MAELDLKIAGGKLATATGVFDVDIGIRDGKIAAIGAWGNLPPASEMLDAKGRLASRLVRSWP